MTEVLSFCIALLAIIAFFATLLSFLVYSRKPQLLYDLSYTKLRTKKIQYKKQTPSALVIYDRVSFLFGWITAFVAALILLPVLMIYAVLLLLSHIRPIITHRTIIGKGQKPTQMYRFNAPATNTSAPSLLTRILIFLDKTGLSELPQLFNILRGDITLFGLTQVSYDKVPSIAEHNDSLLQQYSQFRPGLVSLSTINLDALNLCDTPSERYEIISYLNSVFLARRSGFMLLNVLKTVTLLCFRQPK